MSKPSSDASRDLESVAGIAREAGRRLKVKAGGEFGIRKKGDLNLVTEADVESEKFIVSALRRDFPGYAVLAEEGGRDSTSSGNLWIIDPLDGTTNFAHHFPLYGVSIALERDGEVVLGVVYEPNLDELYSATKNGGAYLNGRRIAVSGTDTIGEALLATGFPYDVRQRPREVFGLFEAFTLKAQGIRRPGAASIDLCFLASGRIDGFWELGLQPWDTAAAALIVSEAGGRLTNFDGDAFEIRRPEVLASNARVHSDMLGVVKDHAG